MTDYFLILIGVLCGISLCVLFAIIREAFKKYDTNRDV